MSFDWEKKNDRILIVLKFYSADLKLCSDLQLKDFNIQFKHFDLWNDLAAKSSNYSSN